MTSRTLFSKKIFGITLSLAFSPVKTSLCLFLAAVSVISCSLWFVWPAGLVFGVLYALLGFLQLEGTPGFIRAVNLLWCAAVLLALCILGPLMVRVFSFFQLGIWKMFLNLACCCIVYTLMLVLTGNWRTGVTLTAVLLMGLFTVNGYVYVFRSRELAFVDIYAASTALEVVDQYQFQVPSAMLCSWLVGAGLLCAQLCIPKWSPGKQAVLRLGALGSGAALTVLLLFGTSGMNPLSWGVDGSRKNGLLLNFYLGIRSAYVEAPEDYSAEALDTLAAGYLPNGETDNSNTLPNIIVIMDEAMADFSIFPNQPVTNTPITPFMDSLQEDVVRGYALASVFGGNTANSEFEFLTSHSMAYLPGNSVPYQQYIREEIYTLPWLLRSLGYTCKATHSYHAAGWARDATYPLLGFEESTFIEDYPCEDLIRSYVSDREQFSYMLDMLDSQSGDAPLFLFGVTMQNHGGYTYSGENYSQTVFLEGYDESYPQAEQYFSLLHETDQAFEYLLTSLEQYPEDTVVLIFGDHFPVVEEGFYEALNGGPLDTLDEQMQQYMVPFILWANYDITEQQVPCTSLNYLAGYLLEAAGLEQTAYYRFLSEMEQTIPAMNAFCYYAESAGSFLPLSDVDSSGASLLQTYRQLQFNNLFDPEHRNSIFFAQYLPESE